VVKVLFLLNNYIKPVDIFFEFFCFSLFKQSQVFHVEAMAVSMLHILTQNGLLQELVEIFSPVTQSLLQRL
jgi:hypothetical protein